MFVAAALLTGANVPAHSSGMLHTAGYHVGEPSDDVDPTDFNDVMWALSTRCNPSDDLDVLRNTWSTGLDPSQYPPEARPYGSKVLINACKPHRSIGHFPPATLLRRRVYERAVTRWNELGFVGSPPKLTTFHEE